MRSEPSNSVQVVTATPAAASAVPCILTGLVLSPAAALSTVTVYDNASAASGTILMNFQASASGQSVTWGDGSSGIIAQKGLWVVVTGVGATANVQYAVL